MLNICNDSQARSRALQPTSSFIVQAPAGSGKTELLTQRVLKLLACVEKPEEILALTFTRKAASEMKHRIIDALLLAKNNIEVAPHKVQTLALAQQVLLNDQRRQWDLLSNSARLNITTIDSLCAKIVKQTPVLSNIGSEIQITEDAEVYYKQAINEVFKLINTDQYKEDCNWTADFKILLEHFGCNYNRLQNFLIQMLYKREQWLPYLVRSKQTGMHELMQHCWQALSEDLILSVQEFLPLNIQAELQAMLVYAATNIQALHIDDIADVQEIVDCESPAELIVRHDQSSLVYWQAVSYLLFTSGDKIDFRKRLDKRLGFPSKSEFRDKVKQQIAIDSKNNLSQIIADLDISLQDKAKIELINNIMLLRKLPAFDYSKDNWQFLTTLSNVLTLLEAELRIIFKKHNITDFSGIGQGASFAFEMGDVNAYFDHTTKHVLVDEFQDTSYSQYQLLCHLTQEWDQYSGKTLFLVGDPMQSIYKFRQAEVSIFLDVKNNGLGNLELEFLSLDKNFRSEQQIVDWVNTTFSKIMPVNANMLLGAVTYANSTATKNLDNNLQPKLNLFAKSQANGNCADENTFIVDNIQRIIKSEPGCSIAILVRNRSRILDLVLELKRNDINISAVEIELLASRMVIQDLWSLTKAILDLSDKTAWLSVLRAPWCGLTLQELYLFNFEQDNKTVWQALNELMVPDTSTNVLGDLTVSGTISGNKKLTNIISVCRNIFNKLYKVPFYKLIKQAWYALGGHIIYNNKIDHDDAEQYFELLFKLEDAGIVLDLDKLEDKVTSLYSNNSNSNANSQSDYKVEIMTIHKSKGLQFDHVFIPYLDSIPKPSTHQILLWQQYHNHHLSGILLAPYYFKRNSQVKFYESLRYIDKQKETYELSRLLYVAVTRAIKSCVLTASFKEDKIDIAEQDLEAPNIKTNPNSMLSLLINALPSEQITLARSNVSSDSQHETIIDQASLDQISQDQTNIEHDGNSDSNDVIRSLRYLDPVQYNLSNILKDSTTHSHASFIQQKTKDLFAIEAATGNPATYLLTDDTLRLVGIFVHKIFYNIVKKHLNSQDILSKDNKAIINNWRNILLAQGVGLDKIQPALDLVMSAVLNTLRDPIGQWILADHEFSLAEHQVYYQFQGSIKSSIIDRIFIDDGCVWIIDYKTTNEEVDNQEYGQQLLHYKYLVGKLFSKEIKSQNLEVKTYLYYALRDSNKFINTTLNLPVSLMNALSRLD